MEKDYFHFFKAIYLYFARFLVFRVEQFLYTSTATANRFTVLWFRVCVIHRQIRANPQHVFHKVYSITTADKSCHKPMSTQRENYQSSAEGIQIF